MSGELDEVGQHRRFDARQHRRHALGDADAERLLGPPDPVPRGDPLERGESDPALTEPLDHDGAVCDARWTADDSNSRVRSKHISRSSEPTARTTNDDRPSARRRSTLQGDGADIDETDGPDDARGPITGGDQCPVARRGALVGVRMPGVVELGQQQVGEVGILGHRDLLITEFVAESLNPSGRDLGVTHPTSLPLTAGVRPMRGEYRSSPPRRPTPASMRRLSATSQ